MTSHDVVGKLRRITGESSIGHLGTLDPMATGVLPLLLGRYTRLAQYFSSAEKSYTGAIRLGFATDTFDAEGQAAGPDRSADCEANLTLEQIRSATARFHGEMLHAAALLGKKSFWRAVIQAGARRQAGGTQAGKSTY